MRVFWSVVFILLGSPALAGLKFCNESQVKVEVAIGYSETGDWTSEGWWHLDPGECKTVKGGDLTNRYYYYRASGDGVTWGNQNYYFCTGASPFTIVGDKDCDSRGYEREAFNEIKLEDGITDFTMTLNGPGGSQKSSAEPPRSVIYGLQSHCDVTDAGIQCEMHDDWVRYVSYVRLDEDTAVHDFLMNLAPNTPVVWEGSIDVADAGYAEMRLERAEVTGEDPMAETRFGVQGSWISDDDADYMLFVNGGVFEEWYAGTPTEASMFDIVRDCPGAVPNGLYLEARSFGESEPRCFEIVHYDDHSLELFPVGTMRILSFSANGM